MFLILLVRSLQFHRLTVVRCHELWILQLDSNLIRLYIDEEFCDFSISIDEELLFIIDRFIDPSLGRQCNDRNR